MNKLPLPAYDDLGAFENLSKNSRLGSYPQLQPLVGFIQALVFLLLTAIFLKLQVGDDNAHGHASKNEEKELPVPDRLPPGKTS